MLLFLCPIVTAQEFSYELEAASQYVFRGVESGDFTLHPSVEFGGDSFYGGVWAALPQEEEDLWSDEFDFYLGHGWSLNNALSLDLGAKRYHYPEGEDSTELYLGLSGELSSVATSFYIYRDFDLKTWTGEASAFYGFPFFDKVMELNACLGNVQAIDSMDYSYYELEAEVLFELNAQLTFSVGAHLSDSSFVGPRGESKLFGTLSLTGRW